MPSDVVANLPTKTAPLEAHARLGGPKRVVVVASLTRSLIVFRLELLKAMVALGHEVTALAPDDDEDAIATLREINVRFRRIPMARTGTNPLADLATLKALYGHMRDIRPDLVLAYTMKPIIYGGLAARLAGVKQRFAMFTGFGYLFSTNTRSRRTDATRRLSIWLYRSALVGTKAAFVYNDDDAGVVRRNGMIAARTPLIPIPGSGVDLDRFAPSAPQAGPPVFLVVARLLREKGIAEFAAAARALKPRFPQARFQILGPFDPSPGGVTPAELRLWTEGGAVEYLGETPDVRPYLAASTVFVLPSYREGIPRSALEAMATGRPVITTDAPGCRETVVQGVNGIRVPLRDAEALAAAMEAFLFDPSLAPRMGAKSRELVAERFDVQAVNRTLLASLGLTPST